MSKTTVVSRLPSVYCSKSLKEFLAPQLAEVRVRMEEALRSDVGLLGRTNASVLASGGKMIRPAMALLIAGACGNLSEDSYRFAAATELLHNATLMHDDVVDSAGERRGQPTVSSILGAGPAVLLGDYWLVKAMGLILSSERSTLRAVGVFSKTLSDLAEGELLQMELSASALTRWEDYRRIVYCKTASLFEAAAVSAAISAGAGEEVIEAMGRFGTLCGLAFQIRDDIFDYVGTPSIGKPVGIDLKEGKITAPLLAALDEAPFEEASVREKVRRLGSEPQLAAGIREFVLTHRGIEGAEAKIVENLENAVKALSILPDSREKSYLSELARHIGERTT